MAPGPGPSPGPPYDVQVTDEDITSPNIAPSGQRMQASSNVQTARGEIDTSHEEPLRSVLVNFTMHSISQATSVPAMDVAAPSLLDIQNPPLPPPPFTPGHIPDQISTWQDISPMGHELSTSAPGYGHNSCSGQNSVTSIDPNQLFANGKELQISNHIASLDPAKVSSEAMATSSTRFETSSRHDASSFEILMPPQFSECASNAWRDTISRQNDFPNSMPPSRGNPCAQNDVLNRRNQQRSRIGQITTATDGQGRIYEIHQEVKWPELAEFGKRLRTFRNTTDSRAIPISPEQLASAGFYLIRGSYVKCFACDQGLDSWESTDDPFLEHVFWYGSTCPFVYAVMQRSRNRNTERNLSSHSTSTDAILY